VGIASQDLLYALRTQRKNPVFVITAVLTLALAIGGNTAMFTVIRTVLLNPLQFRDPDRLVYLSDGATPTRFTEAKTQAQSFTALGAFSGVENLTYSGATEPEVLKGTRVSADFLQILGVAPLIGRQFRREEDTRGGKPIVMISAELWQRLFGSDPTAVDRPMTLDGFSYTIIGILPPHFSFPDAGIDIWMTTPSESTLFPEKSRALSPFLTVFGRLKPGVTFAQANAEMTVIHKRYAMAHPAMLDATPKKPFEVAAMKEEVVSGVRSMLWMLFGAVGFVLTIACANVANLLLTRAVSRTREFAVRSALGASRTRLVRQLLAESLLLAAAGGALGILLAAFALRAIPSITAFNLPRATEIHLDWPVLTFAAALSLTTGILFGLVPSLSGSRPDLMHVLRTTGEGFSKGGQGRSHLRSLLSVAQIALSVILLIGAALLLESVTHLRGVALGFNPKHLVTASISLPSIRYNTDQKKAFFLEELTRRLAVLPGVNTATVAMSLPMMSYAGTPVQDADKPELRLNERLIAKMLPVSPTYFRTLQVPLRGGREFSDHDTMDAQRVAIIDEALAHRFWPDGQNPVGHRLLIGGINLKSAEIVGVVADVHQSVDDRNDWKESIYVPFAQSPPPFAMLAVRTDGDPLSFTRAIRQQMATLDRDQALTDVQTMEQRVDGQMGQQRLLVMLLGSFAGFALLLALLGIYGVIAYSVAQRVQEVGIRRALGAQHADILRLIVGEGFVLALSGVILGLSGAVALTRVISALLFQVSPTDPLTFAAIALLFLVVGSAATYIPARRAARIDPNAALRV
jgi:putative ABC transport system permease protein